MAKSALQKAMDLLALRPLTEFELHRKLESSGNFHSGEVDEAIRICRDRGYLNDPLLAEDAVRFLNSCSRGRGVIRQKLRARGVDQEILDAALEQLAPEDEEEAARNAAAGKLRLLVREKDLRKKREKLFRFMISRGFSPDLAGRMVKEMLSENSPDGNDIF